MRVFLALLVCLVASSTLAQEQQEEKPFTEPEHSLRLGLLVDLRAAFTDGTRSFLDGGLGKLRYGAMRTEIGGLSRESRSSRS